MSTCKKWFGFSSLSLKCCSFVQPSPQEILLGYEKNKLECFFYFFHFFSFKERFQSGFHIDSNWILENRLDCRFMCWFNSASLKSHFQPPRTCRRHNRVASGGRRIVALPPLLPKTRCWPIRNQEIVRQEAQSTTSFDLWPMTLRKLPAWTWPTLLALP